MQRFGKLWDGLSNANDLRTGVATLALPWLAVAAALGAVSCSIEAEPASSPSISESTASLTASPGTPVTCSASLTASLVFKGSVRVDGTAAVTPALPFAVPAALPIVAGSSKNGQASLQFTHPDGSTVVCNYVLKNGAAAFAFSGCSNGDLAGAAELATSFVLHIQNADHGVDVSADAIQIGLALNAPDGSACHGANECFGQYACQSGACVGSRPVDCTASDVCHAVGTCNPTTGACSNPAAPDGTACDDGNACTLVDACQAGVCAGASPVTCVAIDACHLAGTCDPSTGVCSNPTALDGSSCDDGNACTLGDTCQGGACAAGAPAACTALDACHVAGTCDPGTGACSNPFITDGTPCSDGNACDLNDTCQSGVCTAGLTFTCPSGLSCAAFPQVCVPTTCAALGLNCGFAGDGCGGQLNCGGSCPGNQTCGGGGTPGVCGPLPACTNLCLQQTTCPAGTTTTVHGTVYAPNGTDPIYNALVYVPNAPVEPFARALSCGQCSADVSGAPLVSTHSGADGTFVLSNVPVGSDIPLVIQLGRWRRQVVLSAVSPCVDNAAPADLTRFPKNGAEGDIPFISLVTGSVDQIECVLRKAGLDDAEFTAPSGGGHVQLYVGNGSTVAGAPPETQLYGTQDSINQYDMTVLACEGTPLPKTLAQQQILINYANAGGRVFATHYNYTWLDTDPPFSTTAMWQPLQTAPASVVATVDPANPQGANLSTWLLTVGASTTAGQITLNEVRRDFNSVNPAVAQQWLYWTQGTTKIPLHYTFETPVGAPADQQCGRVLYSDFHVAGSVAGSAGTTFPAECDRSAMTPQEHMLEFMLFDLASCVSAPPPPSCTPRTCADQGISCGAAGDGCGQPLDCGACSGLETCGGGGVPGVCGNPFCR